VASLALCLASPAAAQTRDSAGAEALFEAGREALEKGDYEVACQRFEESNRLESAAGTILNLANCRERLGQLASAWQRYREAVHKLPGGDERVTLAREGAARLEPRVPRLTIKLAPGAPAGAVVARDGIELGSASLGLPLPVDPGDHVITVSAPGHAQTRVVVALKEAERRELVLEAGVAEPEATAPTSSDPASATADTRAAAQSTGSGTRTLGFVIGGVGVAGLAVSLVAGAKALSAKSTVDDECLNNLCTQAGLDAADSGKTWITVSNVAAAVGVVGVGVGAYLMLSARSNAGETALAAQALPGGGALRVRGRF